MLVGLATWVIVGHSERRRDAAETDELIGRKLTRAVDAGLRPILCVGEHLADREAGRHAAVVRRQVIEALRERDADAVTGGGLVIAYEPIWAIGTGRTATPDQAQDAIAFVRGVVAELDADAAGRIRILYGGSVKPDNAAELLALPDVDGALAGGASLDPGSFAALVEAAAR
jgi:triosephosphate isomerase (TIM)